MWNQSVAVNSSNTKTVWYSLVLFLCLSIVAIVPYINNIDTLKSAFLTSSWYSSYTDVASASSVEISLRSPVYGELVVVSYLPWDVVAEPYKEQILSIKSFVDTDGNSINYDESTGGSTSTDYTVIWSVNGETYTGKEISFQLDIDPQILPCSVTISRTSSGGDSSSGYIASRTFTLAVKYVRREIRSLSEEDRYLFLRTLRSLYDLSTEDGQALYGDKYVSAEGLLFRHLNGAGRSDCDHWHDGAGIVVQHMAFTLLAEQSLQAVEPSIAMPYWEYAQDASLYNNWYEYTSSRAIEDNTRNS
jgi:hypothetical protein